MIDTENRPRSVGRFEFNLLRIVSAILEHTPFNPSILSLMGNEFKCPKCLSPTAIELLEEALAKGVVRFFAIRGWHTAAFLRDEEIVKGSLWDRTPAEKLGLEFSPVTVRFLMDVTSKRLQNIKQWNIDRPRTIGDEVVIFLTVRALAENERGGEMWDSRTIKANPLVALMYPDRLAGLPGAGDSQTPDFLPWMDGPAACLLEAMQEDLASRWVEMDQRKWITQDPVVMKRIGNQQQAAIDALLAAVEQTNRWDLCAFLLSAINQVVDSDAEVSKWIGNLSMGKTRLAKRAETYDCAVTLLRIAQRLAKHQERAVGVGYFDEGYKAAQLWKTHWEAFDAGAKMERIDAMLKELRF